VAGGPDDRQLAVVDGQPLGAFEQVSGSTTETNSRAAIEAVLMNSDSASGTPFLLSQAATSWTRSSARA
jgi:hypothetical protein